MEMDEKYPLLCLEGIDLRAIKILGKRGGM